MNWPWSKKNPVAAKTPETAMIPLETKMLESLTKESDLWEVRRFGGQVIQSRHHRNGVTLVSGMASDSVSCDGFAFSQGFSERWNEVVMTRVKAKELQEATEQRQRVEEALKRAFL